MSEHRGRRFLVPRAGQGNGRGYRTQPLRQLRPGGHPLEVVEVIGTRTAMIDEPEAVGPAVVDAYAELARTHDQARHELELEQRRQARELLTAEQRLADARARAKHRHVNLTGEFHAIRGLLDRATRGGRHEPPAALRMLERVEAQLDDGDAAT